MLDAFVIPSHFFVFCLVVDLFRVSKQLLFDQKLKPSKTLFISVNKLATCPLVLALPHTHNSSKMLSVKKKTKKKNCSNDTDTSMTDATFFVLQVNGT